MVEMLAYSNTPNPPITVSGLGSWLLWSGDTVILPISWAIKHQSAPFLFSLEGFVEGSF